MQSIPRRKVLRMPVPSEDAEKAISRRRAKRQDSAPESPSPLRTLRIRRGLTQAGLASLAGMHRNSIRKIEDGTTREITSENAEALASALKTAVTELGVRVRPAIANAAIRIRQLTAEQRRIMDEILSLPPEDFVLIRGAIEKLRQRRGRRGAGK